MGCINHNATTRNVTFKQRRREKLNYHRLNVTVRYNHITLQIAKQIISKIKVIDKINIKHKAIQIKENRPLTPRKVNNLAR